MRKYGKYERMPDGSRAKQPAAKTMLLQTYLTSLLCMVLCVAMFFGTTYAWFTSEVTNEGNEIYIGTLDVDLRNAEGNTLNGNAQQLFDKTIRWEPGYTAVETVTVVNQEGSLAFRYELTLKEDGNSELNGMALNNVAKWFDVWCYHDANNGIPAPANYDEIIAGDNWTKVGRLDEVLSGKAVFRGNMTKDEITADPTAAHTYTIALHMNGESGPAMPVRVDGEADDTWETRVKAWETEVTEWQKSINDLMGKKIGLNVKLVATQLSSEPDAFNATYDLGAFANTLAQVNNLEEKNITFTWGLNNSGTGEQMELDTAYQFLPNDSLETVEVSPYRYYHADFVVKADKDVPAESIALAGYYKLWCEGWNNNNWVALYSDAEIKAGEEIRLVYAMGNGGISVNYEELCRYGNDGIGFKCGAVELEDSNGVGLLPDGTTITVELRLYETEAPSDANGNSTNVETGKYVVVGSYSYTFE